MPIVITNNQFAKMDNKTQMEIRAVCGFPPAEPYPNWCMFTNTQFNSLSNSAKAECLRLTDTNNRHLPT